MEEEKKMDLLQLMSKTNNIESPIKSKISIEEKSKENIDTSESDMHLKNLTVIKCKSPKCENKTVSEMPINNTKMPVNNTEVSHKEDVINQITPSKVLKKIKISDNKVILLPEQDVDLKHKASRKEEFNSIENAEFKKKDKNSPRKDQKSSEKLHEVKVEAKDVVTENNLDAAPVVSDYFCEKDDFQDIDSENSLHIDESVGKINEGENDNYSKDESTENTFDSSVVKDISSKHQKDDLIHAESQDNTNLQSNVEDYDSDEPIIIAEWKPRRILKKKEFFEDITSRSSTQSKKSGGKQGKDKRGNDEDSKQGKKNTNYESEAGKNQEQSDIDNLSKSDLPVPETVPSVEPKIKSQEIDQKSSEILNEVKEVKVETKVEAKDVVTENNLDAAIVSDYFCEKDDFKDIDSENSLHIDESVGKIYEGENDDYSKDESTENTFDSSVVKDISSKHQKDDLIHAESQDNTNLQSNVEDYDSDEPIIIAEWKPRRILKKKEFFEGITSRSSTQSKKSGAKQGKDKRGNDEDSKQGKKNTNHKSEAESDEESETE